MNRQTTIHTPWNKGELTGQKAPLRLHEIYAIRVRLELGHRTRDLALFNLAIDSKLRACDLLKLRVQDVTHGAQTASRAVVMQQKTKRPVRFEITLQTRKSLADWIARGGLRSRDFLVPSRIHRLMSLDLGRVSKTPSSPSGIRSATRACAARTPC